MPAEADGLKSTTQLKHSTGRSRRQSGLAPERAHPTLASTRPISYPNPTDPALRANPFPEVTDLICQLPLPTLFYGLEALHLGNLLRIWIWSGTKITPPPQAFEGPTAVHQTPREARCFMETTSLSPGKLIPGSPFLTKKRELFPGLSPTSPGSFVLPCSALRTGPISKSRFGNINPTPFR